MWFAARPGNEHCQVPAPEARPRRRGPGVLVPEWRKVAERPQGTVRARADRRRETDGQPGGWHRTDARSGRLCPVEPRAAPASRLRAGRRGGPRAAGAGQDRRESRGAGLAWLEARRLGTPCNPPGAPFSAPLRGHPGLAGCSLAS
ncbi:hypothetical protein E5288_WYG020990 [Bos mutus]|uniref:Uncharacterized protein n=1 Tax=Bos mutus TaxID=72004 RepID=A0A6B0S2W9_9CETA|nr:hypothetical protein [Bos mutus]